MKVLFKYKNETLKFYLKHSVVHFVKCKNDCFIGERSNGVFFFISPKTILNVKLMQHVLKTLVQKKAKYHFMIQTQRHI